MHDKSVSHINQSKNQERELEQLKKVYEKKVSQLKDKDNEYQSIREVLNQQRL